MIVIFPKESFYRDKPVEFQRIVADRVKQYLDMLSRNNVTITCLLEDCMAHEFLKDYKGTYKVITAITKPDYVFIMQYPDKFDIPKVVLDHYDGVQPFNCSAEKQYVVDDNLMFTDLQKYMEKSVDAVRKRHRYAINKLIEWNKAVLVFDGNHQTNMCSLPSSSIELGDGRLCIEVKLNGNSTLVYYGGVYVPEDQLETIIKINGGQ